MSDATTHDGLHRVIGFWGGLALVVGITIGGGDLPQAADPRPRRRRPRGHPRAVGGLRPGQPVRRARPRRARLDAAAHRRRVRLPARGLRRRGGLRLRLAVPAGVHPGRHRRAGHLLRRAAATASRAAIRDGRRRGVVPAIATATIVVLSTVNLLGARLGSAVQSVFAILKVGALAALIVAAFTVAGRQLRPPRPGRARGAQPRQRRGVGDLGLRRVGRGEHDRRARWWPRRRRCAGSSCGGMLVIVVLYVGANIGYFYALPVEAMAAETGGVPQRIMSDRLGPIGAAAHRRRHPVQRVRGPERQHPRQAARRLRAGPRRADLRVPRAASTRDGRRRTPRS